MNLTNREKNIFIASVVVIITAVSFNFIIEPFIKKWRGLNNEILIQETKMKKGLKLFKDKDLIIREYSAYALGVNDASKLLGYIERQAVSTGIKTGNIRPRPLLHKGFYEECIIELQIEGGFEAIDTFISNLSKSPIFIVVKEFDLRAASGTSSYFTGTLILSKIII